MIRRDHTKRPAGEQLEDEEGGRRGRSRGHSIYGVDSNDASSDRALHATTATTIITLRGELWPTTVETIEMDATEAGPVITAPSPALFLASHRQPQLDNPTLNRLRSEGPPSYNPSAPEQSLSQLPPEYNALSGPASA
ncbi:hypothetical protein BG006_001730 [Podila minutissima]|uniref:Uncharacterized protein n=1 Tax=Podila minutissima TaxID=64525 RepID=A0A9P5VH39_9FUNG|nr:hypothetical protein BG006_001730 [Podila minutissima]